MVWHTLDSRVRRGQSGNRDTGQDGKRKPSYNINNVLHFYTLNRVGALRLLQHTVFVIGVSRYAIGGKLCEILTSQNV
jgi:hypothetical protein